MKESIISHGGVSYLLIANNLTQTFYLWDSTGFILSDYRIWIRAFSVDVSVFAGPFNDIPADYWPGDYGNGFIYVQSGNHIPWPAFVTIVHPSDMTFHFGELGNNLTWNLIFSSSGVTPSEITYIISHNESRYLVETIEITGGENPSTSLALDEFSVGLHIFTLELSYLPVINSDIEIVQVQILPSLHPLPISMILLYFGAGGMIVAIALSIIVYVKQR